MYLFPSRRTSFTLRSLTTSWYWIGRGSTSSATSSSPFSSSPQRCREAQAPQRGSLPKPCPGRIPRAPSPAGTAPSPRGQWAHPLRQHHRHHNLSWVRTSRSGMSVFRQFIRPLPLKTHRGRVEKYQVHLLGEQIPPSSEQVFFQPVLVLVKDIHRSVKGWSGGTVPGTRASPPPRFSETRQAWSKDEGRRFATMAKIASTTGNA